VFVDEVVAAEIHFERDEDNVVTGLGLHEGGREPPGAKEK